MPKSVEKDEAPGNAPGIPGERDYSQRPQKPIRLKPGIDPQRAKVDIREAPPAVLLGHREATTSPGKKPTRAPISRSERWTLQGVSPETRSKVARAAKKAGVTNGDWVDAALRAALEEEPPEGSQSIERLQEVLGSIDRRLRKLERRSFWGWMFGRQ